MQLQFISIARLIIDAGGDPWAINDSLQVGRPAQISDLAQAFRDAGQSTTESDTAFEEARNRFAASWNRENGQHPINDAAEVRRVTKSLGLQAAQLPKIADDLENIAAALAEAQRESGWYISALDQDLDDLDDEIGDALDDDDDKTRPTISTMTPSTRRARCSTRSRRFATPTRRDCRTRWLFCAPAEATRRR